MRSTTGRKNISTLLNARSLLEFPNCKINIGLNVTSKREDGYHNIETIFYPLPWYDILEIIAGSRNSKAGEPDALHLSGITVPGTLSDNICLKAAALLRKDFPRISPLAVHLHKTIPAGAGLGGGSADGAFTLLLLDRLFELGLSARELTAYALQLGSDCPFFIHNTACFATGRGEQIEPVSLDLSAYTIVLINPGIHINTGWAFSQLTPAIPSQKLTELIKQPLTVWKNLIKNDFEEPVLMQYPQIAAVKEMLYAKGALFAAMTGTGSTVYGIFAKDVPPKIQWDNYPLLRIVG